MNTVYLILGIYYEEDYYECKEILGVHKTLKGAIKELLKLVDYRPYKEYKIEDFYLGN